MSWLKSKGEIWLPPPELSIAQWADEYRRISPEASAEPGRWYTDRAPYQREMLNAVKQCERVVFMTSAQIGKTEILLNVIGYYIDREPSPILLLQPTLQMGESFSKERLVPMIRDTPCLASRIDLKARTSDNNILHKKFDNTAHITIAGSNSPASLASRPIRILLCDEVDRYPESAEKEGDPISLAQMRTQNFWNRKIILVSTPTMAVSSRIEKAYNLSTMEEWNVPCPECHELTPLLWENVTYKDLTEPLMTCPHCHKAFPERDWKKSQRQGVWIATNGDSATRGFHMNAFASPWTTWNEIVRKYEEAFKNGDHAMKVWVNTSLGLPYENLAGTIDAENVMTNAEDYGAELPDGVLVLTCGIDVQDNRIELEVVGWGLSKESWGIDYRVIYGTPDTPSLWNELDAYLQRTWTYSNGEELGLSCVMIDSAGHFTDDVYKFVRGKSRRNIFAIVGRGRFGMACVSKPSRNNRARVPLYTVGVSTLKGMLFSRLNAERGEPGYCHFPIGRGYTETYFKGLLAERMVIKRKDGQDYVTWELRSDKIRNEPLDCRVYATAALELINPDMKSRARKRHKDATDNNPPPAKPAKKRRVTGGVLLRPGITL